MPSHAKIAFVTGGSGYVGRNILRALVKEKFQVRALARSDASAKIVQDLGAEPVLGDLADTKALGAGMTGAKYLVHAAADTDHGSAENSQQEEANLDGTRNVYSQAAAAGIQRAIHLSSEAVLLTGKPLINADEMHPIPDQPAGGYSRTKAQAEQIALQYSQAGLDVMVLRPRFIWGRDDTTALPQLIDAARTGKLSWIGGGRYLMSTTHIDNVIHGLLLTLEKGRAGEVYFVTDGEPVEFRTFITQLLASQNQSAPTREVPRWLVAGLVRSGEFLQGLTGGLVSGPMSWQEYAVLGVEVTLNIDKAQTELGYSPIMSREQGLLELSTEFNIQN